MSATVKMIRERLCAAQREPMSRHESALHGYLIALCDVLRPLGPDGKHGDRHTALCGCDDRAHPSTAAEVAPGRPHDASGSGNDTRVVCEPHRGVQSLADDLREFAVGLAGGTWTAFAASSAIEGFADRAEVVEGERDRLTADLERTAEAADRAAVRLREVERERDEARDRVRRLDAQIAGDESLRGGSWKALRAERDEWKRRAEAPLIDHKRCEALQQRAEKAEAAVARVRKVLPELVAIYRATNAAAPVVAALVAARVLVNDALDGSGLSLDTAVEVDR